MNRLFCIISCIFLFPCCKKEKDETKYAAAQRVKTVTNTGFVTNYVYDEQKRIVRSEAEIGFFKDEFSYSGTGITRVLSEPSNTVTLVYELDENGYAKSSQYNNSNSITFYKYATDGKRLRTYNNESLVFEISYYYNAGTGLLDSARAMAGNVWKYTNLFSFFSDRINTIDDENFGQKFVGYLAKCPVKSIVTRKPDGNSIEVSFTNYSYTYDDHGRVASRSFSTSGGQSGMETYTYY